MNFDCEIKQEWEEEHNFDGFCRAVLRNEARNCYSEIERQSRKEVMFCDMSKKEMSRLYVQDSYSTDYTIFRVSGYEIYVSGEVLIEAIKSLKR